ncbi:riboflavin synthase [Abyssisolibacter fermentans]|uniref:riboflavin synthase n=1 Tax=Abyssisolibacter fermentans TaxID=1766203 RepID=UPI00082ACD05|nr:riboflavin synthase [Abyssisolibacter fermentans]
MFTGLVEEIGQIKFIKKGVKSASITINASKVLEDIKLGDSISVNGICLTVVDFTKYDFTVDVMPETLRRTNLKRLSKGSGVNLERAMKVGDRFGGHIVSGHIDGIGIIKNIEKEDNAVWLTIKVYDDISIYVVKKGSIAVDGISLTVADVNKNDFQVSIIPLTNKETILSDKKIGDELNIECDMIGKYIHSFMSSDEKKDEKKAKIINIEFLRQSGFLT